MPLKLSFLLLAIFAGGLQSQEFDLKPGKMVPSFTLPTAREHKAMSTDSFVGKKTMLHVFASW